MGQGFSVTTPSSGAAGIDIPELADLAYEKTIGSARFMKSIRARHHEGIVLVKVFVKPYGPMSLDEYRQKMFDERKALAEIPNALGYQRIIETETNGYLVRQYLYNSLYDRLSTRPFLEDIERKWLSFQLLCALRDCHAKEIYHGDIKAENTLVTSWNWLYLSDFSSSFKPVTLPDDNPTDFSYFFDTSSRRTCYIAPERFVAPGEEGDRGTKLTWAMDVFSAGCVIAELFLEAPIFSLSQLYKYRKGEYDPDISHLSRISDKDIRELVSSMIQLDPQKRYSAEQCLEFWKGKAFPDYFYTFLHQYMEMITDPSSGQLPIPGAANNWGEADERIDRVFYDFDKISYFLGYQNDARASETPQLAPRLGLGHFPVRLNIPNNEHAVSIDKAQAADDGTLIFLTLVVSSLRNTARASSKVRACDVLLAFAERLTDEAKLDRVLPYLITLLNDKADIVVITAIRTITQLLALVNTVNPVNAHVFLEYILPRFAFVLYGTNSKPSPLVRATYASCIGNLATTAKKFLQMATALNSAGAVVITDPDVESGSQPNGTLDALFDEAQQSLIYMLETHTKNLIEDVDPYVRRAFLSSVPELCLFFGTAESNDIILSHLNTYLNDRDWMLKCAFFETVVGIAAYMGSVSLEEFILPLMIQALTDTEENVVQGALHSLAELANLGLLSKTRLWELVDVVARFSMHPNIWVREAAAEFIAAAAKYLSPADVKCILFPMISTYLKSTFVPAELTGLTLLNILKRPLSRSVFDQALLWAVQSDKGLFWKSLRNMRRLSFGTPVTALTGQGNKEIHPRTLNKISKNEEDEQWLGRLRNLGLAHNDEFKLLALREFIWRLSQIKTRDSSATNLDTSEPNDIINLRTLEVTVQTVMFDEEVPLKPLAAADADTTAPRTITDALMDASMSIDDPVSKRRRAAMNSHRSQLSTQANISPTADDRQLLEDGAISGHDDPAHTDGTIVAKRAIRHTSGAINLLGRKDSNKATAATGTTDANATGRLEGLFSPAAPSRFSAHSEGGDGDASERLQFNHNYPGSDPHILKMLDSMYTDNYPHDVAEFGPMVTPVVRKKTSKNPTGQASEGWKPTGNLVATFSEHSGAVNRIAVSPDHVFFITGGDDGTVKVWDTERLERNIAHRSRQTHRHGPGAKITALCFIETTHSFISCASDGSVHVVKVETAMASGGTRYGKLRLLREYQLPDEDGEFAVWCEHYKQETSSTMVIATNQSRILSIDLRTMNLLYVLENPVHHGTPTCFCIDKKRNWLCVGTSHGVLDLWDLRFKMRLKGWGVPGKSSIYRLSIHPIKGRGKWVCVSGGTGQGEVTVWDLEKTICREIYRVGGNKEGPKGYDPWDVDEDRPEGMLGRFATSIEPSATGSADRGVRAMAVGSSPLDGRDQRDVRHAYILTGGSDKKLRFWDLTRVENSTVFSGLMLDEGKPTYSASHPTTSMTLNTERLPRSKTTGGSNSDIADGGGPGSSSRRANGSSAGGVSNRGNNASRANRTTVISVQQQQLLKSHLDSILDVALLERPCTMTVSVDRSGVVFVFQ